VAVFVVTGQDGPAGNPRETTMKYLLLIYGNEQASAKPAEVEAMMTAFGAYTAALTQAKAYVGGERLHPTSSATTVRVVDGKSKMLDGPYADTKEQLGGYYVIDVPDLDAALGWAAKCPAAQNGSVEVRAVWPVM
jgi:hypothetical protein